jgi:penicillin-binding protein 1A
MAWGRSKKSKKDSSRTKGAAGRAPKKNAIKKEHGFVRRISLYLLRKGAYWGTVFTLWGGIIFVGLSFFVLLDLPSPASLDLPERSPSVTIKSASGEVMARRGTFSGDDIRLDELPDYISQAVIATEDRRFYAHFGVDPIGLVRALIINYRSGKVVQGGSTITQQLAKNLFLNPDRTIRRKIQEMVMAVWLEAKYSKTEILQLYLNRVYFGAGAFGVDAAARRYFSKSAGEVTLAEAAVLAGLLKAPTKYAPTRNPRLAEERAYLVLNNMVRSNYITKEQGQRAVDEPASIVQREAGRSNQYIVDWVVEQLPGFIGALKQDIIVETTLDPRLQVLAEKAVNEVLDSVGAKKNATQAALVALDGRGAVRALVGGRSYADSQFNRAVKAKRQPGSAFKPFVYLAALENGFSPESRVVDRPVKIKGWSPKNYNKKYRGDVSLRESFAKSLNTVAVQLAQNVGTSTVLKTARRLGIKAQMHENPSMALGTAELSPLELTAAYVPFANGGEGVLPFIINRIRTKSGAVIYERLGSGPGKVIKDKPLDQINDLLAAVTKEGTGRKANFDGRPIAGKTGTSQGFRDAWFLGFSAQLTTGVWVGNDDGSPMKRVSGSGLPTIIWRKFMAPAHQGFPVVALPGSKLSPIKSIDQLLASVRPGRIVTVQALPPANQRKPVVKAEEKQAPVLKRRVTKQEFSVESFFNETDSR